MAAVAAGWRDDIEDVDDVALLVALSEASFEPVLVDDAPTVTRTRSRRSNTRQHARSRRRPRRRMHSVVRAVLAVVLAIPRAPIAVPRALVTRVHVPRRTRRTRVRRYAVHPIVLEGPRRVPVEVLDLTPSVDVDLRMQSRASSPTRRIYAA